MRFSKKIRAYQDGILQRPTEAGDEGSLDAKLQDRLRALLADRIVPNRDCLLDRRQYP